MFFGNNVFPRKKKRAVSVVEAEEIKKFPLSVAILRENPLFCAICKISETRKQAFVLLQGALIDQGIESSNIACFEKWEEVIKAAIEQVFFENELRRRGIFFYSKN